MSDEQDRKDYEEYVGFVKRQRAKAQSLKNIEEDQKGYSPVSQDSGENFTAGVGRGMNHVLNRAMDFVGASKYQPIKEDDKLDEALLKTGAGATGNLLGEIAATAPLGMGVGGLAGLAGGGARGAELAAMLPRARTAARGANLAGAAVEGAATGALTSNEGEGAKAALIGALTGGAMNAAGQVGGAVARKLRPEITDAARKTMKVTGTHIPISQALPQESLTRQLAAGVAANIPGETLREQAKHATEAAREHIFEKALPEGVPAASVFQGGVDDVYSAMKRMKGAWDSHWDDIKAVDVQGFRPNAEVADVIKATNPRGDIPLPQFGKMTKVDDVLKYKAAVQQLADETPGRALTKGLKKFYQDEVKRVDTLLTKRLSRKVVNGENLGEKYAKSQSAYNIYDKLKKMAGRAKSGEFDMQQAERVIAKSRNAPEELRDFVDAAQKANPKFPSNAGPFQTVAALSLIGGAGGAAAGSGKDNTWWDTARNAALGAGTVLAAGKGMSTKRAQKMLAQYDEKGFLDKYAEALRKFGSAARSGVIAGENQ